MRLRSLLPAAAVLFAAGPLHAQRVVYWTDEIRGTSVIPSAIAQLQAQRPGLTAYAATSQADFTAQLSSGTTALAIFGQQGNLGNTTSTAAALGAYLAGGGRVLGASWVESGITGLLGASGVASQNGQQVTGSGVLFAGISSPLGLDQSLYFISSQGYVGGAGTSCFASLSSGGCAALQGNGGASMLLAPLFDTYADPDAGGRFVANGANLLLGAATSTVPEPSTYALIGTGLLSLAGVAARRKRTA